MRGGLLNRFRLSDAWAINLDLRFDVFEETVAGKEIMLRLFLLWWV